jgi:hypothetical protein
MTQTKLQRAFAPLKAHLPSWVARPLRSVATAVLTPILFSYRSGHFLSSLKNLAVSRTGAALPWYTYPCIEFLTYRPYERKRILEFGGGQSTTWWAARAEHVVAFEGDKNWFDKIKAAMPKNVDLHYALCVDG